MVEWQGALGGVQRGPLCNVGWQSSSDTAECLDHSVCCCICDEQYSLGCEAGMEWIGAFAPGLRRRHCAPIQFVPSEGDPGLQVQSVLLTHQLEGRHSS